MKAKKLRKQLVVGKTVGDDWVRIKPGLCCREDEGGHFKDNAKNTALAQTIGLELNKA